MAWNDSKATNVDAAVQAIQTVAAESHHAPIVLVAGGVAKAGDHPEPFAAAAKQGGVRPATAPRTAPLPAAADIALAGGRSAEESPGSYAPSRRSRPA